MQSTGTLWFPFFFFGRGWGWGHQLYKVQFMPLKICTVWLHKSSLMDRSLHGSLKNKASRSKKKKKQRHYFADKSLSSQSYGLSSSHVWMWELDYKESWVLKNWCFWNVVLEKTLGSLGVQGDQTSESQRKSVLNTHWKASCCKWNLQYFGYLMQRTDSLEKTLILGQIWRQEEKGMTEDEMVGSHHWLDDHEFEQAPGVGVDREAWHATVHGVTKSQTGLSN